MSGSWSGGEGRRRHDRLRLVAEAVLYVAWIVVIVGALSLQDVR